MPDPEVTVTREYASDQITPDPYNIYTLLPFLHTEHLKLIFPQGLVLGKYSPAGEIHAIHLFRPFYSITGNPSVLMAGSYSLKRKASSWLLRHKTVQS